MVSEIKFLKSILWDEISLARLKQVFKQWLQELEKINKNLISPCVVCEEAEEVDSGMCKKCRQEALEWANEIKKKKF